MKWIEEAAEKIAETWEPSDGGWSNKDHNDFLIKGLTAIIEAAYRESLSGKVDYTEEATRLSGSAILQLPTELMIPELAKVLERIAKPSPIPDTKAVREKLEAIKAGCAPYFLDDFRFRAVSNMVNEALALMEGK